MRFLIRKDMAQSFAKMIHFSPSGLVYPQSFFSDGSPSWSWLDFSWGLMTFSPLPYLSSFLEFFMAFQNRLFPSYHRACSSSLYLLNLHFHHSQKLFKRLECQCQGMMSQFNSATFIVETSCIILACHRFAPQGRHQIQFRTSLTYCQRSPQNQGDLY